MTLPASPSVTGNPYVGPRPFERGDSSVFFGRDLEARQLVSLVLSEHLVLFYAQSGAGKSSLINARLVDKLEEQGFFVLPVARVSGQDPVTADGTKVDNVFIYSLLHDINDKTSEGEKPVIAPSQTLAQFLRLYSGPASVDDLQASAPGEPPLEARPQMLIIDQFEELFTAHPAEWRKREDFFLQLRQALEEDPKLWVLLALREDFVAAVDPFAYLFPGRLRARFYMQRLNEVAAGQAISTPASRAGKEFESQALAELVRRLRQIPSDVPGREELDQFVEPLILQVVCYNLWEHVAGQPSGTTIGLAALESAGDVDHALTIYYNQQVLERVLAQELPPGERPLSEMALRLWIETRLITPEGRRSFVYEEQGAESIVPSRAVRSLYKKRLLNQGRRENRIWYELAHDRLVRPIRAANDVWWRKQGALAMAARAWLTSGRTDSALALDPAIEQAIEAAEEKEQDPLVIEFLVQARKRFKRDLSTTGWGVIFAEGADPAVRQALHELLQHRRRQASQVHPHYYREFTYRPGMTSLDFVREQNAIEGTSDPEVMPYYLLIVGGPEAIPFTFEYQLDVDYAVGRIAFECLSDYAAYAHSVVEAERRGLALPRQAVFFSPSHTGVQASSQAISQLVGPTVEFLHRAYPDWDLRTLLTPPETSKARLSELLGGTETPALIFTTSMSPPISKGDPRQLPLSGALITSDWPGLPEPFNDNQLLSAADITPEASLLGLVAFFLTNHSAGTPQIDNYASARGRDPNTPLADRDFIARLPMRLLSHPAGGALAVIGHIDEAFFYSIGGISGKGQSHIFRDALARLLNGSPVGAAMDVFNQRYTMLSAVMFGLQSQEAQAGVGAAPSAEFKRLQHEVEGAIVDARNYIILGDPAVRLSVGKRETGEPVRPRLQPPAGSREVRFHPAPVVAARWSPDGANVLTVCQDGGLRVWHAETPKLDWEVLGQGVVHAAWRPDGKQIAALTASGEIIVLDPGQQGQEIKRLSPGPDQAGRLAWSPDGGQLAVTSDTLRRGVYLARLWDVPSGQVVQVLRGHTGPISAIGYHPNGDRLLTASQDGTAREWTTTGNEITVYGPPPGAASESQDPLVDARFSPDGSQILTASARGTTRFISAQVDTTWAPRHAPRAAALSPDGQSLAEADEDGAARIYSVADRTSLFVAGGHGGPVNAAEFSPAGDCLLTAGADGDLRLWNVPLRLPNPGGTVNLARYSPDGALLASAYADDRLRVWQAAGLRHLYDIQADPKAILNLVFSPDGASLAASDQQGSIRIWDTTGGQPRLEIKAGWYGQSSIAFSLDSQMLLSYGADKKLFVWDAASGQPLFTYQMASFITKARFSQDGRLIYMISLAGSLELIDWRADVLHAVQVDHPKGIRCAVFGPSNTLLATGGDDCTVRLWNADDGKQARLLEGHRESINHVAFSPDGGRLLSASRDHSVRIWDVARGRETQAFCDCPGEAEYAVFSPDGRRVLARWTHAAGNESGLRAWEALDGTPFLAWSLRQEAISQVELRPDGKQVLVLTDRQSFLLPLRWGLLPALAERPAKGMAAGPQS